MDILVVITLACFFALFVGALAIARRVRIVAADPDNLHNRPHWAAPASESEARNSTPWHPPEQAVHQLIQQKEPDWRFLISEERRHRWTKTAVSPTSRKPPASVQTNAEQRLERVSFNRGLVDLNDPYETSHRQAANGGIYLERHRREANERIKRIK